MTKIKGIEFKNVKKFSGHDGECYQGNLYLNGKKIGSQSQDSWGGPDDFDFTTEEAEKEFKKIVETYYCENLEKNYYHMTMEEFISGKQPEIVSYNDMIEPNGMFMGELLKLTLDEKKSSST